MKVVSPNDTSHTLTFIPRYYPTTAISFTLINEVTKVEETITTTNSVTDGILSVSFDYTFAERDKYNIKISEGNEIVYRGDLFCTEQEPQDFDITLNYITYE